MRSFPILACAVCWLSPLPAAERGDIVDTRALVGHWPFNEGGGAIVRDRSGQQRPGEIRDRTVQWIEGKRGRALRFTGGATQVQVPPSDTLNFGTGEFTIAFWVRFNRVATPYADTPISRNGIGDPCRNQWTARGWTIFMEAFPTERLADGTWRRDHERAGPFLRLTDAVNVERETYPGRCNAFQDDLANGAWHHVAFVRTGPTTLLYYRDGVRVKSNCQVRQPAVVFDHVESPLTFGCGFTGDLDEVRIYRRALSDDEMAALFGG